MAAETGHQGERERPQDGPLHAEVVELSAYASGEVYTLANYAIVLARRLHYLAEDAVANNVQAQALVETVQRDEPK